MIYYVGVYLPKKNIGMNAKIAGICMVYKENFCGKLNIISDNYVGLSATYEQLRQYLCLRNNRYKSFLIIANPRYLVVYVKRYRFG